MTLKPMEEMHLKLKWGHVCHGAAFRFLLKTLCKCPLTEETSCWSFGREMWSLLQCYRILILTFFFAYFCFKMHQICLIVKWEVCEFQAG